MTYVALNNLDKLLVDTSGRNLLPKHLQRLAWKMHGLKKSQIIA